MRSGGIKLNVEQLSLSLSVSHIKSFRITFLFSKPKNHFQTLASSQSPSSPHVVITPHLRAVREHQYHQRHDQDQRPCQTQK